MQQTTDWLEKLGLSEYAQRFAENRIDFSVLRELTDQDLEKIGVVLGDRRKIMRAIRELGGTTPVTQPSVFAAAKPQDTAERRQVTVMFSDLVGSTALSARMDPEDLREVISAYQKCVAATVQRFGGFVAKYMGDGVLVYVGYPQAHEDDAERAVGAGLVSATAVTALKPSAPLQTRASERHFGTATLGHREGRIDRAFFFIERSTFAKLVVTRTRDGDKSFDLLTNGLPQSNAYDIVYRHAFSVNLNGDELAFRSTAGGLGVSEDQGESWLCVTHTLCHRLMPRSSSEPFKGSRDQFGPSLHIPENCWSDFGITNFEL
jgi:hypothetical protein